MNGKNKPPCESCVYFDVIDEAGNMGCTIDIDEDDLPPSLPLLQIL